MRDLLKTEFTKESKNLNPIRCGYSAIIQDKKLSTLYEIRFEAYEFDNEDDPDAYKELITPKLTAIDTLLQLLPNRLEDIKIISLLNLNIHQYIELDSLNERRKQGYFRNLETIKPKEQINSKEK